MKTSSSSPVCLIALALVVCAAGPIFGQNAAATVVARSITKVPFTITQPGTYVLRKDLAYGINGGTAITIAANNVILDLGGRVLSNTAPQDMDNQANGINLGPGAVDRVTVRNGTVRGFAINVNLYTPEDTGRFVVENVVSEDAGYIGLRLFGASIRVANCTVLNTGYKAAGVVTFGISAYGRDVVVHGNTVNNLQRISLNSYGINVTALESGLVKDNLVSTSTQGTTGISLAVNSSADGSFAEGNYISNFVTGLDFPSGGKYRGNLTRGCTTAFSGGTAVGSENN